MFYRVERADLRAERNIKLTSSLPASSPPVLPGLTDWRRGRVSCSVERCDCHNVTISESQVSSYPAHRGKIFLWLQKAVYRTVLRMLQTYH